MTRSAKIRWQGALVAELAWFVRLRWLAVVVVLLGSLVEWRWLHWYGRSGRMALVGAAVLAYNLALTLLLPRLSSRRNVSSLLALAWVQLLLDLGCLTVLTLLTGGLFSPLLGFFVFHMVFASLLLPRRMAYAGASAAMLMLSEGLWLAGQWPAQRSQMVIMLGWIVTLLMTVWLSNGITRDLREHRRRLMRKNRRIRKMSHTLQLQHHGMIQQEKMAAAGRMAAGVAHEIANPLASMDGLLQLMERRPDKVRPEAVATLREQVARISQIVRRMTAFAHPGDGQWQEASLNDIAAQTLELVRFDPRLKNVEVEKQFAADLPRVRMQTDAIQQVIMNLVINALDAMETAQRPRLVLRTTGATDCCILEICDNGQGIEDEHLKRLFEPFFTTKPPGKGTGLGLSISYNLVRSHGGSIDVESRPGEGARFTVRLPTPAASACQQQPSGATAS